MDLFAIWAPMFIFLSSIGYCSYQGMRAYSGLISLQLFDIGLMTISLISAILGLSLTTF